MNNGRFERICAYEGESLLKALQNFAVDGIPGINENNEPKKNKMNTYCNNLMTF